MAGQRRVHRDLDPGPEPTLARLEVLELDPRLEPPTPPPLRLFADLPDPVELPYAPRTHDPTGTAGLWRAIASL